MTTTHVFQNGDSQVVKLPPGFEFADKEIAIRREGDAVILEPIKSISWPANFFSEIRIDDSMFKRPDPGEAPPAPRL
jgi:virulence-associated protein VagC